MRLPASHRRNASGKTAKKTEREVARQKKEIEHEDIPMEALAGEEPSEAQAMEIEGREDDGMPVEDDFGSGDQW